MSKGLICDQCGETLALNDRGEAANGEDASWVRIAVAELRFDACTRACAHELLDDPEVIAAIEAWQEVISDIARTIQQERDKEAGDES